MTASVRQQIAMAALSGEARLDHDVCVDTDPYHDKAEALARGYRQLLVDHDLTGRFGVYVRRMGNKAGWGIFLGPHDAPHKWRDARSASFAHARRR